MKKILTFTTLFMLSMTAFANERDNLLDTMDKINRSNFNTFEIEKNLQSEAKKLELLSKTAKLTSECNQALAQHKNMLTKVQSITPEIYRKKVLEPVILPLSEAEAKLINQQTKMAIQNQMGHYPELLLNFDKAIATQVDKVFGFEETLNLPSLDVCELQ